MVRLIDSDNPKTYDAFRNEQSSFHRKKYDYVFSFVEKNRKSAVLEIGAGTGTYTRFLVKDFPKTTATDLRVEMIQKLKEKKIPVKAVVADSMDLPFKKGSFDLVVGISLFHHIAKKDRKRFFLEAKRVLKKGGQLVLTDPNKLNPFTSIFQLLQGEYAISRFEFVNLLEQTGFEVKKTGEILARTPGTSDFLDKMPLFAYAEKLFEQLLLGVTVFVIAKKI